MINLLKFVEGITKSGSVLKSSDSFSKKENKKKVLEAAADESKKVKSKIIRADIKCNKRFKYDKKKLSLMYGKDKMSELSYDYLVGELIFVNCFGEDTKGFEKLFERIIKAKSPDKLKKAVRKYEKVRSKYICS